MKKILLSLLLAVNLTAFSQAPFSSQGVYIASNLDSVRVAGILKSGSVWVNRTFWAIDIVKNRLKISDTANMLLPYATKQYVINTTYTQAQVNSLLTAHTSNTSNPHNVTKAQVGLSNVPNVDATNPANITQDGTHRFATDAEKATWNAGGGAGITLQSVLDMLAAKGTYYLSAITGAVGGTVEESAKIQQGINYVADHGGGVLMLDTTYYSIAPNNGGHGIYTRSNVAVVGKPGTIINLLGTSAFFTTLSNINAQAVITQNTVDSNRVIHVNTTEGLTVGQTVLVKVGTAIYDVPNYGEPDHNFYGHIATMTPFPYTIVPGESFVARQANVITETANDDEVNGLDQGVINPGVGYLDYTVTLPTTTTYSIMFRVSSFESSAQLSFKEGSTTLGTVAVPNTGAWQSYTNVTLSLSLAAGSHTFRIFNSSGSAHFNLMKWYFAPVSTIPSGYTITLDQPIGYTLDVNSLEPGGATIKTRHKSIVGFTELRENIAFKNLKLVNDGVGVHNAEYGFENFFARNLVFDHIDGVNTGAGLVQTQYVDNITIESPRLLGSIAQGGRAEKGRFFSFAESKNVTVNNGYLDRFQNDGAIVMEGKNYNVTFNNLRVNNSFIDASGNPFPGIGLFTNLGNNEWLVNNLYAEGNGVTLLKKNNERGKMILTGITTVADGCPVAIDEEYGVVNLGVVRRNEQTQTYNYYKKTATVQAAWPVAKSRWFYGAVTKLGTWNASTNTPTLPAASSGNKGQYYKVATAGTFSAVAYSVGDLVYSDGSSWSKIAAADAKASYTMTLPSGMYTNGSFYSSTNTGATHAQIGSSVGFPIDYISTITGGSSSNVGKAVRIGTGVFGYGNANSMSPTSLNNVDDKLFYVESDDQMTEGQLLRLSFNYYIPESTVYGAAEDVITQNNYNVLSIGTTPAFRKGDVSGTIKILQGVQLPVYASNALALAALGANMLYTDGSGGVFITH